MRKLALCFTFIIFLLCLSYHARGQESFSGINAVVEYRIIQELEELSESEQPYLFDWGVWIRPSYTIFDDEIEGHRAFRYIDVRPWMSLNVDNIHRFYFRGKFAVLDWNHGDSFDGRDDDIEGMNLDQGFYEMDISNALRKYFNYDIPLTFKTKAGRQFIEVGTGLVYSQNNDGIKFSCENANWESMAFLSRTIHQQDNIDQSVPDPSHSDRRFAGIQVMYKGLDKHEPYLFGVIERDYSGERPEDIWNEYDYDANYLGIGSKGEVARNLRYFAEGVWQSGRSYPSWTNDKKENIEAFAVNTGLEYFLDMPTHPKLAVQYAFGSGDKDRGSVTNTLGGNMYGTDDMNFLSFGYINSGYALVPRLSNLHFVRTGASFLPLEDCEAFKDMEIGLNYYHFWKHRSEGVISDTRANMEGVDVGDEIDLFLQWKIFSDLDFAARYGVFFPGEVYYEDDTRFYINLGFTYIF